MTSLRMGGSGSVRERALGCKLEDCEGCERVDDAGAWRAL